MKGTQRSAPVVPWGVGLNGLTPGFVRLVADPTNLCGRAGRRAATRPQQGFPHGNKHGTRKRGR